jgi:arylsulfatase A-like enzyme
MWTWTRMRWIAGLAALAGLACGEGERQSDSARPAQPATADRPNVIVILTDDQASSSMPEMKHTQALLVREGTSFSNFFINDPICCPSRGTILLGEYRQNHRLEKHDKGCGYRFFEEGKHRRSLGKLVDDAGYRTGYIGKYLNSHDRYIEQAGPEDGGDHLLMGWDDYHVVVTPRFFGFRLHENGSIRKVPSHPTKYQTDVLFRTAARFITASAAKGERFFLFIAPDAPHAPAQPAVRHQEAFPQKQAPRVPSFNLTDVTNHPGLQESPILTDREIGAVDSRFRGQLRSLKAVDEMVRDLVAKLEAVGQIENTYILFASDNGYHFGEHRIPIGKGTPFEASVRVPLVIRGPGVVKNRVLPQLATNADLLPTILDLVGGTPGERVDGRSLTPLFGPGAGDVPWRNAVPLESRHAERNQGVPAFGAIRTRRFKWIEYENGGRALYDLANDPHEMTNLHGEANAAVAEALSAWLRDLLACSGATCRSIEDETLDARLGKR